MQVLMVIIGIVMIVMGIVQILFPHAVWKVDQTFHEMNGVQSRRSDAWEIGRIVRAIVSTIAGVLVIWLASTFVNP